jgi:elongator complex protein 3
MEAGITDAQNFSRLKKDICKKLGVQPPTNADLREHYEKMIAKKEIKRNPLFEKILLSKKIRTESGVAVVAVLTKSYPCPGKCIYCPTEAEMPKSYLSNEPAVMRAISAKFSPAKQVSNRLHALELNGHQIDKIELIVMGGTFSYLPKNYQKKFIAECFRACNEYGKLKVHKVTKSIKSLNDKLLFEQKKNETAHCRIIGLTLETRPDYIDEAEIINFRNLGCTRVELGVQSVFDKVLKINKRGHDIQKTIDATKLLKDAGFKINYHMMPGLPGSNLKKDVQMFSDLFTKSEFQPDMLKIYPTVIVKNCELYGIWKKQTNKQTLKNKKPHNHTPVRLCKNEIKNYQPLTDKQFEKMILKIKNNLIPPYVRIARIVRDVPTSSIVAGPTISNLRQIIEKESACQCIRCREVKADYIIGEKIILDRIDYAASDGREIFLQYVSPDKSKLFALLRLRIPGYTGCPIGIKNERHPVSNAILALRNSALIREVHTYGKLVGINIKNENSLPAMLRETLQAGPQHIGLGKKLILEAESIAKKEFGLSRIAIISGVGVRGYYRKIGYKLQNTYMVKDL